MEQPPSIFNPATPAARDGNTQRLARCRKVVDSLVAGGIALAASGLAASVLIA